MHTRTHTQERRYLLLEFPFLTQPDCRHVVEIGAGCGSAILPVLKANAGSRTTCTGRQLLRRAVGLSGWRSTLWADSWGWGAIVLGSNRVHR